MCVMDLKTEKATILLEPEMSLEKLQRATAELRAAGNLFLGVLNAALVLATNLLGRVFGSGLVRRHFHLLLSCLVLFGPALNLWVSKYSIFANSHSYLYRWGKQLYLKTKSGQISNEGLFLCQRCLQVLFKVVCFVESQLM